MTGAFVWGRNFKSMSRFYENVKDAVTTRDAAVHYGYRVGRNGMMRCPFHDDRNPSMKVGRNYICFGCQAKGDVIDFTARLFGLAPYEAARKLIADMGLVVKARAGQSIRKGTRSRHKQIQSELELFEQAIKRVYITYCDYLRLLDEWSESFVPKSPEDDLHPLFVEAMQQKDKVGYLLDILFYGAKEDRVSVLIEKGREVKALEKRIREFKSGGRECTACHDGRTLSGEDRGRSQGAA